MKCKGLALALSIALTGQMLWINNDIDKQVVYAVDVRTYSKALDGNKNISANFKVSEFACNDGSDTILIDLDLVAYLQKIRDHFNKSVTINSGYRTDSYNAKVGGASQSYHKKGQAADIAVSGVSPEEVAKYAESIGMLGVGLYNSFTHVDTRTSKYFWDNRSGSQVPVSTFSGVKDDNNDYGDDFSTANAGWYKVVTESSNLNIRSGSGTGYEIVGKIPKGGEVYVYESNSSWAYVEYNGVTGYSSVKYLEKITVSNPESEKKWYDDMSPLDVGSNFLAYIINVEPWKHLTSDNGNVVISKETGAATQIWNFMKNDDGSYRIINCADINSCLDVYGFSSDSEANVQVWSQNDTTAQKWYIYGSSGEYLFRAACTDCVLDVYGASGTDGTNVNMYTKNDSSAQKFQIWKLEPKLSVEPGNKTSFTTFSWENFPGSESVYDIKIWKGKYWEGDPYHVERALKGNEWTADLPAGHYEAYMDTRIGDAMHMSNVVSFDVKEDYLGKADLTAEPGDRLKKTHFSWSPVEKASSYVIKIWNGTYWEGDSYFERKTEETEIDVALPAGHYEVYVDACSDKSYQMSNVVKFNIKQDCILMDGDADADGKITSADAIMIKNALFGTKEITCVQNADLSGDGIVNIVDLCLIKEMIISVQ